MIFCTKRKGEGTLLKTTCLFIYLFIIIKFAFLLSQFMLEKNIIMYTFSSNVYKMSMNKILK